MKVIIDKFLEIGNSHDICEDYIITGLNPFPYVIVSDGCSMSPMSDVGARILSLVAKKVLTKSEHEYIPLYKDFGFDVIMNANFIIKTMDLPLSVLDATLIVAFERNDYIHVFVYGDGNIFGCRSDGSINAINISYSQNAPYYLRYNIDKCSSIIYHDSKIEQKRTRIINGKEVEEIVPYDIITQYMFPLEQYDNVLISSDGIESFGINVFDIINSLLNFKVIKNRFIKRRANKVIKNLRQNGITHFDDISIGGFHIVE